MELPTNGTNLPTSINEKPNNQALMDLLLNGIEKQEASARPESLAWAVLSTENDPELDRLVCAAIAATGDAMRAEREPRPMIITTLGGAYHESGPIAGVLEGSPVRCGFCVWYNGMWQTEVSIFNGSTCQRAGVKQAEAITRLVGYISQKMPQLRHPNTCVRIDRPRRTK